MLNTIPGTGIQEVKRQKQPKQFWKRIKLEDSPSQFTVASDYYKATVIKTIWLWHVTDMQNNRTELRVQIEIYVSVQLIFAKGAQTIQWGKKSRFNK